MLLVIDVGNTNIVAGVFDGKSLVSHWRFSTDRSKTADEYGILLRSMFNYTKMPMDEVKAIIISSVVPPLIVPLCHMCERYFDQVPMVVGPGIKTGISLRYDNPREVGADRIVNAVAAFEKYASKGKPMIIVDFGTFAYRRISRRRYCPGHWHFCGGFVPAHGQAAACRTYKTACRNLQKYGKCYAGRYFGWLCRADE